MPGFGFADDELKKLFAEAGEAVKKARTEPPPAAAVRPSPIVSETPAAPPADPVPSPPEASFPDLTPEESFIPEPLTPVQPARNTPQGGEAAVRLQGGEQTETALVARTLDGETVTLPWASVRRLCLGRIGERNLLALTANNVLYFFSDDNVAYKGLLKQMAPTLTMNWRGLVNELATRISDRSDSGVQAVTGGGGTVPRYVDAASFFKTVRAQ